MSKVRFVGLDVPAETIAIAVVEPHGEVRSLGIIPNRAESICRLKKLGPAEHLRVCYEAGPKAARLASNNARRSPPFDTRGSSVTTGSAPGRRNSRWMSGDSSCRFLHHSPALRASATTRTGRNSVSDRWRTSSASTVRSP